ncbi:MAG: crossover junction endodeoxyribonuclease RuvC [Kiritimatiellia bacterium]
MPDPAGTRIMGVDTSLRSTGVGVVEGRGTAFRTIEFGIIKNPQNRIHSECLDNIYQSITAWIARCKPDAMAIEGSFYFKNAGTAMTLGQARGVVMAAAARMRIPVYEYAPRRVKQALTGTGTATKEQVIRMIVAMLGITGGDPTDDEADALALAICHLQARSSFRVIAPKPV